MGIVKLLTINLLKIFLATRLKVCYPTIYRFFTFLYHSLLGLNDFTVVSFPALPIIFTLSIINDTQKDLYLKIKKYKLPCLLSYDYF